MNINTKSRYGLRMMVELAADHSGWPVTIGHLAKRLELSVKYLECIASVLRDAGVLRSHRGVGGGYSLRRRPEEISIGELLWILEGTVLSLPCMDEPAACSREAICPTVEVWRELRQFVEDRLNSITLADLVARHNNRARKKTRKKAFA